MLMEVKKKKSRKVLLFVNKVTLLQICLYQIGGGKSVICATFMGLTLKYFTVTVFYCHL